MSKKFISTKMKIFLLVLLILSIVSYASGCIILIQSNYSLSDYSDELNFNSNSFKYNFDFKNNFLNFTNLHSSNESTIEDNISEINLNMKSQKIEVVNTNSNLLNIKIKSFLPSITELNLLKNDNKMIFSPTVNIPNSAEVIISIPLELSNKITLKVTTSSGDINITNYSSNTINASSASGDINFNNCDLNYLYSSSSSGDINMTSVNSYAETNVSSLSGSISGNGNFAVLTGSTSSGDIDITFKDKLNNVFLSAISGDIDLYIPSNCGYEANYSTSFGELNVDENIMTNGDKSSSININTTSGDLSIQLK